MSKSSKIDTIIEKIEKITTNTVREDFIFDLLRAYGKPDSTINRLQSGSYNQAKNSNEILWKKQLYYRLVDPKDLYKSFDKACAEYKEGEQRPRFIIITDGHELKAYDTKDKAQLSVRLRKLSNHVTFFLPLARIEKTHYGNVYDIDVRAAKKVADLYDEIKKNNRQENDCSQHSLNILFTRILYCLFAEDTGLFPEDKFTNTIATCTQEDGSDLGILLNKLFLVLDSPANTHKRKSSPKYLRKFPYVNGGAFKERVEMPKFTAKARRLLIECGQLNWREVNPDIFGSMVQTVVLPELRKELGVHYTSEDNIKKLIYPLFVNELQDAHKNATTVEQLKELLQRICKIKVFDPACGSGNFLIVSYHELREIERTIKTRLKALHCKSKLPSIELTQFYGIEIDDFIQHVAIISLCMAEHIDNIKQYGLSQASDLSLPLADLRRNIVRANAARIEWESVCSNDGNEEIYVVSNPPYAGHRQRSKDQREDMKLCLQKLKSFNNLDYVGIWFVKGSEYIKNSMSKAAFVSTNSICQGQQVPILWPWVFSHNIEMFFAYPSVKWKNSAKGNAGVTCCIVGMQNRNIKSEKYIYDNYPNTFVKPVTFINEYLSASPSVWLKKSKVSISGLPKGTFGNNSVDGGHLFLSQDERSVVIQQYPFLNSVIKSLISGGDLLTDNQRYCLWLCDADARILENEFIREKISKVRKFRLNSTDRQTLIDARKPHLFQAIRQPKYSYLAIPRISSERRKYIPCAFKKPGVITLSNIQMIENADHYTFGVISSSMMMLWTKTVGGRLGMGIRFSLDLCYNTFPIPTPTPHQKSQITQAAKNVLSARSNHPEKNLAQLYDPIKMPDDLRKAHHQLDLVIEAVYQEKPFESDAERLECLFKLYKEMTSKSDKLKSANDDAIRRDDDEKAA